MIDKRLILSSLTLLIFGLSFLVVQAQGPSSTAFTYQGQLVLNGAAVNDTCDLSFTLRDQASSAGQPLGQQIVATTVNNGLFTVQLDFGVDVWSGSGQRFLEIAVRCPKDVGNFSNLGFVEITSVPYANYAHQASWNGLQNIPPGFADNVDDDKLGDLTCNNGEIVEWNGSAWVCGVDNIGSDGSAGDITGVQAGAGLTGGGGQGDVTLDVDFAGPGTANTAARSDHNHDARYYTETELSTNSAAQVHWSNLVQVPPDVANGDDDTLAGLVCADDQILKRQGATWVCATDEIGNETATGWSLTGNVGTDPNQDFVGTLDNQLLEMRVNDTTALRLEPGSLAGADTPNFIAGSKINTVGPNVSGATISGGGWRFSTVLHPNIVNSSFSAIGGGYDNTVNGGRSTIGGGVQNTITGGYVAIAGGQANRVDGDAGSVGGGRSNRIAGDRATISGGTSNVITGTGSTIGGGGSNRVGDDLDPTTSVNLATIAGGFQNKATNLYATVGGGQRNVATGSGATVSGGVSNQARADSATIGGGRINRAEGVEATVGGGYFNIATEANATIGGGHSNTAFGYGSTVPGGVENRASGDYSFAAGRKAYANHDGSFVWADSADAFFHATGPDQFLIRASGGVGIGVRNPSGTLHLNTPVGAPPTGLLPEENGLVLGVEAQDGYKWMQSYGGALALNPEGNNIGIGTTTPQARLEVVGGDIRVTGGHFIDDGTTLNTPDYVFEEDYPLLSLDELRTFIEQEKHLPNVPSADEVAANGLNVSQFQMRLLEKIEELTLYTLAQEETAQSQRQQIAALRQQNIDLLTRLERLERQVGLSQPDEARPPLYLPWVGLGLGLVWLGLIGVALKRLSFKGNLALGNRVSSQQREAWE